VYWLSTPAAPFHLFEAKTVNGAYTPVAGDPQGSYTVTVSAETEHYFRLQD
jgi:hypothetical protein